MDSPEAANAEGMLVCGNEMIGQLGTQLGVLSWQPKNDCGCRWLNLRLCFAMLVFVTLPIELLADDTTRIVTRVTIGGGQARQMRGQLRIDQGQIRLIRPLGVLPHSVATVYPTDSNAIVFDSRTATNFEGFDLEIQGTATSQLFVDLGTQQEASRQQPQVIELASLLDRKRSIKLDTTGNQIVVERAPGDQLRVDIRRPHLVFSPGESWSPQVWGAHVGLSNTNARLEIELVGDGIPKPVFQDTRSVEVDPDGHIAPVELGPLTMPTQAGVYRLNLRIESKRLLGSLVANSGTVERSVQLVVVDTRPASHTPTPWTSVRTIYPSKDSRSARPWREMNRLGELRKKFSNDDNASSSEDEASVQWLGPRQWTTFSLGNLEPGRPHQIVFEGLAGHSMQLAMSILDPDSSGVVRPLNLDTGLLVPAQHAMRGSRSEHRWVFWPKTNDAQLLIYNSDANQQAPIAHIELLAGPEHLVDESQSAGSQSLNSVSQQRLVAVQLERPFLNKLFGATDARDPATGRSFDDWTTFYEMANRLAEYCHWAGYNGAIITVASEGGALFPSSVLQPTPRYDNGAFFSDARDPVTKDVIELLLRVFDREGLRLVTTLDLNSPIPALEEQVRRGEPGLIQSRVLLKNTSPDSLVPVSRERYQPIHPQVHSCFLTLVDELARRYESHPAWAGVGLRLGPGSHLCFSGDAWGYDESSLEQFAREIQWNSPELLTPKMVAIDRSIKNQWLVWRADKLTRVYADMSRRLAEQDRPLYLLTSGCFDTPPSTEDFIDPATASADPLVVLSGHGIDLQRIGNNPSMIALRGETWQPLQSYCDGRWSWQAAFNRRLDEAFAFPPLSGAQLNHQPQPIRLDLSSNSSPFASGKWEPWIFPQVSFPGDTARSRIIRRMAADDCLVLTDGGWQANTGQEYQCRDLLRTIASLPPTKMSSIRASNESDELANMVVRSGEYQGQSYVVVINQAPWQETVHLRWQQDANSSEPIQIEWLSSPPSNVAVVQQSNLPSQMIIPPYIMIALRKPADRTALLGWEHFADPKTPSELDQQLQQLTVQLNLAAQPQLADSNVQNGDFELSQNDESQPSGWTSSMLPSGTIALDTGFQYLGKKSLRIESRGQVPLWVQSDLIEPPMSGRLAVAAYVRVEKSNTPQLIQFSVIGKNKADQRFERRMMFQAVEGTDTNGWYPLFLPLMLDMPPEQISQLRLSLDVTGPGMIWLDNLRLYDMFLTDEERRALRAELFTAKSDLDQGRWFACQRFLESYWADYLSRYVPSDGKLPPGVQAKLSSRPDDPNAEVESSTNQRGWLQRLREGVRRKR